MLNIRLHRSFVKMEKRGLTHLLQGKQLELYREYLSLPIEYQNNINQMEESEPTKLIVLELPNGS